MKKLEITRTIFLGLLLLALNSCVKEIDDYIEPNLSNTPITNINSLHIPGNFDFTIDKKCSVNIQIKGKDGSPLSNVIVELYNTGKENGGSLIFKGVTDVNGYFSGSIRVLKSLTQLPLYIEHIDFTDAVTIPIVSNSVSIVIEGSNSNRQGASLKNPTINSHNNFGSKSNGILDSDGDGITDEYDDYPNDALLAFNNYYPSQNTYGHIAFEDLWPYRGDYDMNDLIVGYRYNTIKNSNNDVVAIQSSLYVKSVGGSYINGFGFELPIDPKDISMVIGSNLQEGYINLNSNATEAGQSKAVIIAFDNALNLAPRPQGFYVNTQIGSPIVVSDTIKITAWLTHPISSNVIGDAPFNPFMISNKRRGYEIHLTNMPPTDLADQSLFNTGNDKTNIALNRYYLSDKNIPWALNIPDEYPIVIEKAQIIEAYLKFQNWAQSGGVINADWYKDFPGYRNTSKLLFR